MILDIAACQGSANCVALAPEVFDYDEDANKAVLLVPEPSPDLEEAGRAAEAGCPALAIRLEP